MANVSTQPNIPNQHLERLKDVEKSLPGIVKALVGEFDPDNAFGVTQVEVGTAKSKRDLAAVLRGTMLEGSTAEVGLASRFEIPGVFTITTFLCSGMDSEGRSGIPFRVVKAVMDPDAELGIPGMDLDSVTAMYLMPLMGLLMYTAQSSSHASGAIVDLTLNKGFLAGGTDTKAIQPVLDAFGLGTFVITNQAIEGFMIGNVAADELKQLPYFKNEDKDGPAFDFHGVNVTINSLSDSPKGTMKILLVPEGGSSEGVQNKALALLIAQNAKCTEV